MGTPSFSILLMFLCTLVTAILVGNFVHTAKQDSKEAKASIVESRKIIEKNKWFDNEAKWKKVQRGEKLTYVEFYDSKMIAAMEKAPVAANLCSESKDTCYDMTNHHYYYLNPYLGEYFTKPKLPPFKPEDMYNFYVQERVRRVKVAVDKCNSGLLDQCEVLLKTTL